MRDSEIFAELGKFPPELGSTIGPYYSGPTNHVKPSFYRVDYRSSGGGRLLRKERVESLSYRSRAQLEFRKPRFTEIDSASNTLKRVSWAGE